MNFKGQGTTEYLIILAIIIVIALVVVGVLGGFPSFSTQITESQSKSYWATTSPLSFTDWSVTTSGSQFVVENKSTDLVTLTDVLMNGTAVGYADQNVTAGARITTAVDATVVCTAGQPYSYTISITYTTPDITGGKTFSGARPLIGRCP